MLRGSMIHSLWTKQCSQSNNIISMQKAHVYYVMLYHNISNVVSYW